MIDTSKYENHDMIRIAKQLLIEDAPLLLEEVKRLQNEVEERITAHYTLANGWSRAEQEWEQEKRRLLKQIEQLKEE